MCRMGLFGTNWSKELDRVERLLTDDEPVAARERAERAARKAGPEQQARAMGLVARAQQAVMASLLNNAESAESAGDLTDAADWLEAAIEQETSTLRKAELERRRQSLLSRDEARDNVWPVPNSVDVTAVEQPVSELDTAHLYAIRVSMLREDVRSDYEARSESFRRAVVQLHDGQLNEALPVLRDAAKRSPEDGVAHLELGSALLLVGDVGAARDALDVAWRRLGSEALDDQESLLPPALWAQAALDAGDAPAVVDRLEELAAPDTGDPQLCQLRARALLEVGPRERALDYLERAVESMPDDGDLALLLARALAESGDMDRARNGLEHLVAPSCSSGCAAPPPHAESFRFLAQLHLGDGGEPERARELIALLANRQGGLTAEDLEILAGYYRLIGDPVAAEEASVEAQRLLRASGQIDAADAAAPQIEGGSAPL